MEETIFTPLFRLCCQEVDIDIKAGQAQSFGIYFKELVFWNSRINLTAITAPEDIAIKHFVDSLLPQKVIKLEGSLADIGSGAGFPGVPLKIINPWLCVSLVESNRKKANFLRHIIRTLKLDNISVQETRAENLKTEKGFDIVIARAFSDTAKFIKIAQPLTKKNGFIVVMKGKDREKEVIKNNLKLAQKSYVTLPLKMGQRTILVYQKCFT